MLPHGRGHCISSVSSLPLTRGRVNLQRVPATLARFPGVDARSLTWRKLPQHLLRDRRPADCVERRPHSGGSADPHAGAGGREGWAFTCPLPVPTPRPLPAAALGRGEAVAPELSAPRASLRAAQPTAAAATVPWLGNESPPGGGSRPPTMASLSFSHSPLHPFCCQPPPLNPAPKTKTGWTVEGGVLHPSSHLPALRALVGGTRTKPRVLGEAARGVLCPPPKTAVQMLRGARPVTKRGKLQGREGTFV